jgi:hypothetical protein
MNWHLTVMTADAQQIPFHAKLGSQTEILELASQARFLGASAQIWIRSPVGEVYCWGWSAAPRASAPAHHDALAPLE